MKPRQLFLDEIRKVPWFSSLEAFRDSDRGHLGPAFSIIDIVREYQLCETRYLFRISRKSGE